MRDASSDGGRLSHVVGLAAHEGLSVVGAIHAGAFDDAMPPDCGTLLLLGPDAHSFWPRFQDSAEAADGGADPVDRWSQRVIGGLADRLGGTALFPFGGPPWHPFLLWALRTGRVHPSPVSLLVGADDGLWVSFRGALSLPETLDLPAPTPSPCADCETRPCLGACPVGALTESGYDVPACHAFLNRPEGERCLTQGCAVRRACPAGQGRRLAAQSALHMAAFHR